MQHLYYIMESYLWRNWFPFKSAPNMLLAKQNFVLTRKRKLFWTRRQRVTAKQNFRFYAFCCKETSDNTLLQFHKNEMNTQTFASALSAVKKHWRTHYCNSMKKVMSSHYFWQFWSQRQCINGHAFFCSSCVEYIKNYWNQSGIRI